MHLQFLWRIYFVSFDLRHFSSDFLFLWPESLTVGQLHESLIRSTSSTAGYVTLRGVDLFTSTADVIFNVLKSYYNMQIHVAKHIQYWSLSMASALQPVY